MTSVKKESVRGRKPFRHLKPVRRTSLSDGVIDQLASLITSGRLKAGDRIPSEKDLCVHLAVGRTSVREALRSLTAAGLLETRAGEGTFVTASPHRQLERALQWSLLLDQRGMTHLLETRLMLEAHTAYLAAANATAEDASDLGAALQGMERSMSEPRRFVDYEVAFHLGVAHATHNEILERLVLAIHDHLCAWVAKALEDGPQQSALSVEQHRKILAALITGDGEAARQAMCDYIRRSSVRLGVSLESW